VLQLVSELLGQSSGRVNFSNYHAFCHDVLIHYGHLIGLPAELTVYDSPEDRIQALHQGLTADGFIEEGEELAPADARNLLETISRLKRDLTPPVAAPADRLNAKISVADAYSAYEGALERNGSVDFDGLLVSTYLLFSSQPQVCRHYRRIYRYILIDEAQDTNVVQYEILKALCGTEHRNVFMVADPSQSIYAFAGASSKFLDRFLEDFSAERHDLSVTFRCGARIVELSRRLLPKGNVSTGAEGHARAPGCVTYRTYQSEADEAKAALVWADGLTIKGIGRDFLS
jgi:DNA helicase-2/ATP-dependent DNA helicase PcrA